MLRSPGANDKVLRVGVVPLKKVNEEAVAAVEETNAAVVELWVEIVRRAFS